LSGFTVGFIFCPLWHASRSMQFTGIDPVLILPAEGVSQDRKLLLMCHIGL